MSLKSFRKYMSEMPFCRTPQMEFDMLRGHAINRQANGADENPPPRS